ncbi:hypothetical protein J2S74_005365 [Evansella vedderi]|uniref:Spore germination protein n=1 Tax=Evansella vedderi TaxID=38282 RepID=A0ABU0A335_9BACI|nr:spore germination protein [Evansella vedderi]MDQ0257902.1 hypothetical protein [Evansella vedderi]
MEIKDKDLIYHYGSNIALFQYIFQDASDVIFRPFQIDGRKACLIFIDGLINSKDIQYHVLHELLFHRPDEFITMEQFEEKLVSVTQVEDLESIQDITNKILEGNTVLIIDGKNRALVIDAKEFEKRGISEPESEAAIRGPREGFIENLRVNTSMIRRKIRSEDLNVISKSAGEKSKTSMAVIYLEDVVDKDVLKEFNSRLDRIKIDGILETGYIEELIEDNPWSLFPQVQITERPDTVAANLLEGKIALVVDGTPFVMIQPQLKLVLFRHRW